MLSFHQLVQSPNAQTYINDVLKNGTWSGGSEGKYTRRCLDFFSAQYGFKNSWLTHSCTASLEAAAMLLELRPGDEVIVPSYTYVGTATAFYREGAKLVFADSRDDHPNMSLDDCAKKITPHTRAIVLVHYGGVAHEMENWVELAQKHNLVLIEDAAHCIHSFYKGEPLGSFGHISAFSFHATKNISCGEGGLLVINDDRFLKRAELIMNKGTNRGAFLKGEVKAYEWSDTGSSLVLSEILAAVLWAQLEIVGEVTTSRLAVWNGLMQTIQGIARTQLPVIPAESGHNGHIFFITTPVSDILLGQCKLKGVPIQRHYQALHKSAFAIRIWSQRMTQLPNSERYMDTLLRFPCHSALNLEEVKLLINSNLITI